LLLTDLTLLIPNMPFASERLIYRAPIDGDAGRFVELVDDLQFQQLVSCRHPKPLGRKWKEEFLEKAMKDALFYAVIVLKDTGEFLGEVYVAMPEKKNREAEIGITMVEKHRGKGYGGEALQYVVELMFRSHGVHRVALEVFEANAGAIGLYKKL
jgi:RimJ/RimL family protein N-acetyltransferase